jgi:hypothetical protein
MRHLPTLLAACLLAGAASACAESPTLGPEAPAGARLLRSGAPGSRTEVAGDSLNFRTFHDESGEDPLSCATEQRGGFSLGSGNFTDPLPCLP